MFLLNVDDIMKMFPIINTLGVLVGSTLDIGLAFSFCRDAKKYFESKCKSDDGTIFFITRCYEYEVIFRKFKQFENYELIYPAQ